jgi:hypothetical protein
MRLNNLKKVGITPYSSNLYFYKLYFLIIASIAANEPLSFSLIII